jgi:hypothetical protein
LDAPSRTNTSDFNLIVKITDAGRLDYMCNFALVLLIMFTLLSLSSKVVIKRSTKYSSMLKPGLRAKA